jgi:hypothetical protein
MGIVRAWLPAVTSIISFVFAFMVLERWTRKHRDHELFWGIGLLMYGIGTATEALYAWLGWQPAFYRLWYLFGAILVAAWLGQGTAYLLMRGKARRVAHVLLALLVLGSLYAAYRVFTVPLDPSKMIQGELSGGAITEKGVRLLTPFFNTEGVLLLAGGAVYSAWIFYRKRVLLNRVMGNVFIALGALFPAFGGLLQRAEVPAALYVSELLGVILLFIGFLLATQPAPAAAPRPVESRA